MHKHIKRAIKIFLPKQIISSIQHSNHFNKIIAKRYASSSKRIDICSAQIAHFLHLSKINSLEGKVCLEIGSGWVLTHALVYYLLGAKKVIASDIVACAQPHTLYKAIHESVFSIPRDILSPFADHSLIKERFNKLLSIPKFTLDSLRDLGIEYRAPIDLAQEKLNFPVDFIYSNSVLEHVPCEDIPFLLKNISSDLNPGGMMVHCIHLEDHKDILNAPFDFFSVIVRPTHVPRQSPKNDITIRNHSKEKRWQKSEARLIGSTTLLNNSKVA